MANGGWSAQSTEARLLRLEDAEVLRGDELSQFKREMRDELAAIRTTQASSQRILTSILVAIIVAVIAGIIVAVAAAQLGGAA